MLGRTSWRFLWCWLSSSFCCCSSFHVFLHSHFLFDIIPHPSVDYRQVFRPIPFCTFSPAHHRVIHDTFIFNHSVIFLLRALQFWVGIFYPQAFFYLTLLPNIFGTTCIYQGFPGSQQLFLEISRASYWSSKHRPGPSVCWMKVIHNLLYILNLYLYMSILQKFLLVMKTLIKNIDQQPHYSAAINFK